jgi:hypothetical protein
MGPISARLSKARIADYSDLAANLVAKIGDESVHEYLFSIPKCGIRAR